MVGASACLLGFRCRYNGESKVDPELLEMFENGRVLPICPEVFGGLGIPRKPSYIDGGTGREFWEGRAKVITIDGEDVSKHFKKGARISLTLLKLSGIKKVFLKEKSPSCGVTLTYSSKNRLIPGPGVATSLFEKEGITVTPR